jgi:hypothetical protein
VRRKVTVKVDAPRIELNFGDPKVQSSASIDPSIISAGVQLTDIRALS